MDYTVRILVIRFSSIGDIVLTTPVLRCLKEQLEGKVEIHYLTKRSYSSILENNPHVSKVHVIEKSTNEVISELKTIQFDYVIDLHKNLRSKRVRKQLRALAFELDKLNYRKWLLTNFKVNKLPNVHIVQRYLDTVKVLGIENDDKGLEYYIPDSERLKVSDFLPSSEIRFVAIAIGAQHATKRLPKHKIVELCRLINDPIVLLGGQEDHAIAEEILTELDGTVINACGQYSLNQSASIVDQAEVLITHDTGLMHIGAALDKRIISIWGNTVPAFGMFPYMPNKPGQYIIVENKDLSCRPCSKIGYDKCPKKHFKCMEDIDVKEIVEHI